MKYLMLILMSSLLALFTACGGGGGGSEDKSASAACGAFRVVNGQECSSDALPVVRLLIDGDGGCTGTIVSNDYILTAAHCTYRAQQIRIIHDRGEENAVDGIVNQLFFGAKSLQPAFDIALIRAPGIASRFGVKPAEILSTRILNVGDTIKVVGYGKDGSPVLPNGNPRGTSLKVARIDSGLVVTFFDDTQSGVCQGDSGGAATLDGQIIGTVSFGGTGCGTGNFNVFAWTQNKGNLDFLKQFPGIKFS